MSRSLYGGNHAPQKVQSRQFSRGSLPSEHCKRPKLMSSSCRWSSPLRCPPRTSVAAAPVSLSIHFWTSSSELSPGKSFLRPLRAARSNDVLCAMYSSAFSVSRALRVVQAARARSEDKAWVYSTCRALEDGAAKMVAGNAMCEGR